MCVASTTHTDPSMPGGPELQRAVNGFVRSFGLLHAEHTPCGLSMHVSQAHALGELADGPLPQQVLADRLALSKSTVSRLVGLLADRGEVDRLADPADGRQTIVALTDIGRDVAVRLDRARARRFEALLGALPDERRREVVEVLALLADAAQATARTSHAVGATS